MKNNIVNIIGIITSKFEFSHVTYTENFYKAEICTQRKSGVYDILPILVPEHKLREFSECNVIGTKAEIVGSFRSRNVFAEGRSHLILYILVDSIKVTEAEDKNYIYLDGFVCKKPVYRVTPLEKKITDVLLAVNRNYNRSDYIPTLVWGNNAEYVANMEQGDKLAISGRVQSRYYKKVSEDGIEERVAYEVSVGWIDFDLSTII